MAVYFFDHQNYTNVRYAHGYTIDWYTLGWSERFADLLRIKARAKDFTFIAYKVVTFFTAKTIITSFEAHIGVRDYHVEWRSKSVLFLLCLGLLIFLPICMQM